MQRAFIVLQSLLVVLKQIESSLKAKRFGAMWLCEFYLAENVISQISMCAHSISWILTTSRNMLRVKSTGQPPTKTYCIRNFLTWNMKFFSSICTPNLISTFIVNLAVNNYVLRKLYETHSIYLKEPITRFYNSQGFVSSTPICLCII